ncbi:MAG TPA: PepSY-associated TM helix domain-containing protein [Rhizomicrobium sp.]|nr:PepSY-associated TM helix domain-containing protein [Rhizomicrobium sp.]
MSFAAIRHTLFTVHMWIGLILGVLLAALGLSGSLLVYDESISDLLSPPPRAATAGMPLPLTMIANAAREAAAEQGVDGGQMQIIVPQKARDAVVVRFNGISPMGAMPARGREGAGRGLQMFLDPVSGEVLASRKFAQPPLLTFAHQLHGNFLMSREFGRPIVGWLGVAMCLLGLSGLVLWWPKRGQWKYAFKIRRSATGLRFNRELHAATGIWIFVVFMAVSFSGVVIAWPQTAGLNTPGPRALPTVEPTNAKRLGPTEAVIAAAAAVAGLNARSITIPAQPDRPISVNYLSHDAINATVLIDPYRGKVLLVRDNSEQFLAWMRPVHDGSLGTVWRFLVFLSGLAPALFVVTGLIMWWMKRQRHVPMTAMTDEVTAGEAAA